MICLYKKMILTQILLNMQNTYPHSLKYKSQIADLVCDSPSLIFITLGSSGYLSVTRFSGLFIF